MGRNRQVGRSGALGDAGWTYFCGRIGSVIVKWLADLG